MLLEWQQKKPKSSSPKVHLLGSWTNLK